MDFDKETAADDDSSNVSMRTALTEDNEDENDEDDETLEMEEEEEEDENPERYVCATLLDSHLIVAVGLLGHTNILHVISRSDVDYHVSLPLGDVTVSAVTSVPSTSQYRFLVVCSYPSQQYLYTLDSGRKITLLCSLPHENGFVVAMSQPVEEKMAVVTCVGMFHFYLSLMPMDGSKATLHIESGEQASDREKKTSNKGSDQIFASIDDLPTLGQKRLALKHYDPLFLWPELVCLTESDFVIWDSFTKQIKSVRFSKTLHWEWPMVPFLDFDIASICSTPSYVFASRQDSADSILCLDVTTGSLLGHYSLTRLDMPCPDMLLFDKRKCHLLCLTAEPRRCVGAYVGKRLLRVKGKRFRMRTSFCNDEDFTRCP